MFMAYSDFDSRHELVRLARDKVRPRRAIACSAQSSYFTYVVLVTEAEIAGTRSRLCTEHRSCHLLDCTILSKCRLAYSGVGLRSLHPGDRSQSATPPQ